MHIPYFNFAKLKNTLCTTGFATMLVIFSVSFSVGGIGIYKQNWFVGFILIFIGLGCASFLIWGIIDLLKSAKKR